MKGIYNAEAKISLRIVSHKLHKSRFRGCTLDQATEGGIVNVKGTFSQIGDLVKFWGADSQYGCYTNGRGGVKPLP